MSSVSALDAFDHELTYANFMVQTLALQGPAEASGEVYNQLSEQYRKLAVSSLLIEGDLDAYAHGLITSALTRRELLRRPAPKGQDHASRASFLDPVLDALAVGQTGLAAQIGRISPTTWFPDFEYEEDFLYAQILFGLAEFGSRDLDALVDRHEQTARGAEPERNAVCRALIARDPAAFVDAFEDVARMIEAEIAEVRVTAYRFNGFQEVSIEGLALLHLADQAGLPTEREYRHCPSWARRKDYAPYVPDSFPMTTIDG